MPRAKTITNTVAEASDGRKVDVRFMDDGAIRLLIPGGQRWAIAQHRTGPQRTFVRLVPVTEAADEEN